MKKLNVRPSPKLYCRRSAANDLIRSIPLQAQEAFCGGRAHQIELPRRYLERTHFTQRASLLVSTSHRRRRTPALLLSPGLRIPKPPSSLGQATSFQDMYTNFRVHNHTTGSGEATDQSHGEHLQEERKLRSNTDAWMRVPSGSVPHDRHRRGISPSTTVDAT